LAVLVAIAVAAPAMAVADPPSAVAITPVAQAAPAEPAAVAGPVSGPAPVQATRWATRVEAAKLPRVGQDDPAAGQRFFKSIFGGAELTAASAGTAYYRYGGAAPDSPEALASDPGALSMTVEAGENTLPGTVDYSVPASSELSLYATVRDASGNWQDVEKFIFPAYLDSPDWFALPSGSIDGLVTQTVVAGGSHYQFSGLSGVLEWLNGQDLEIATVPVELGSAVSGTGVYYQVDASAASGVTVPLRLNGFSATPKTPAGARDDPAPLGLTGGTSVALTVDGSNTLTVARDPYAAGLGVPADAQLTIYSSSRGVLKATGGIYGAGIGGAGVAAGGGTIEVRGSASVTAVGGFAAAGIGAGQGASGGNVWITDSAEVTATGGSSGAGIGGSNAGNGGTIKIDGKATVDVKGGSSGAGLGGGSSSGGASDGIQGGGGNISITGAAIVRATGTGGSAGIGGGYRGPVGTVSIGGTAEVTASGDPLATGTSGGPGIGSGDSAGSKGVKSITIGGQAKVDATGAAGAAAIGGAAASTGGAITITDNALVTALAGERANGIGGGANRAMGIITISGQAKVWARGSSVGAGIGGNEQSGGTLDDCVRITGQPTVVASGAKGAIGGSSTSQFDIHGSVIIEGGFVAAKVNVEGYHAIGGVKQTVTISGGSVYQVGGTKGISGIQSPTDGAGHQVYPLYIPAFVGGADLTSAELQEPPFDYAQQTITAEQREFIASTDPDSFPLPAAVPATAEDGTAAKLAAVLWVPSGQRTGLEINGAKGFSANVTSGTIGAWGPSLAVNVLSRQAVGVTVEADGKGSSVTTSRLVFTFSQPVEGLTADMIQVTDGTAHIVTYPAGLGSSPDKKTWTLPVSDVWNQGTVNVNITSLPGALAEYALDGVPALVKVYQMRVTTLTIGRTWRPTADTAVVGFGSDITAIDEDNPEVTYWYAVNPGDMAPEDGAQVRQWAEAATGGLGGTGKLRVGQMGSATANSIRISGLPNTGKAYVYIATVHPDLSVGTAYSQPYRATIKEFAAPVNLVALDADVSEKLSVTAAGPASYRISGARGEFERINGLVLPNSGVSLELNTLDGVRQLRAAGDGSAPDEPVRVRLNRSVITGPSGQPAVELSGAAALTLEVVGANQIEASGSRVATVHVPSGDPANALTITGAGGTLGVTMDSLEQSTGIGGNYGEGAGQITVGGDVRLTVSGAICPAIGGGCGGPAGNIRFEDQAFVKVTNSARNATIGSGGNGSGWTNQVTIAGGATVQADGNIGGTGAAVSIESGFTVARSVKADTVVISGGSVYTAVPTDVQAPEDAEGKALYPLYVPAVLADGRSLTDLDVGGSGLPYVQHTVTAAQKAWLGTAFPAPAGFPAKLTDAAQLAAVLWVPDPGTPGFAGGIKLGKGPGFAGAAAGAARIRPVVAEWSEDLESNVVAVPVTIGSLEPGGESGTATSGTITMSLDPRVEGLTAGQVIVIPGTGRATVTAVASTDSGKTYSLTLGDEVVEGLISLGFATHSYVAEPEDVELYRDEEVTLSGGPGVRYFTSIGGNVALTSNWAGAYHIQFGGERPATAQDLAASAGATGALAQGTTTINAGVVTYDYPANQPIPVYAAIEAANGVWSDVVETYIPAYSGDTNWFALPAGTASDAVTATAQDQDNYRLTGLTGDLSWLNGRDLDFGKTGLELNSSFSGQRSFIADGAKLSEGGTFAVRLNGAALTGVTQPFALVNGANLRLTVDGSNTLIADGAAPGGIPTGLTAGPGTHLEITSATGGAVTARGHWKPAGGTGSGPGIGSQTGAGAITIGGNVVIEAAALAGTSCAGIGGGRSTGVPGAAMGGPIVIGGQARVYAIGSVGGSGIGGSGRGDQIVVGAVNSIVITDDALVVAKGGEVAAGIGGGTLAGEGVGSVTISGGTVLARPGASNIPAIGALTSGSVTISGGNVYASGTEVGVAAPVDEESQAVYPLYAQSAFGSLDLLAAELASEDWTGVLKTLTPSAREQLDAWGVGSYWDADLAGVAWVPADLAKGQMYGGFTADGQPVEDSGHPARAFVTPQFRTFASAKATDLNILTDGLNPMDAMADGAKNTVTTKTITFTLDQAATILDSMVSLEPLGEFDAIKDGALALVDGSDGLEYRLAVTGDWPEGGVLRVTFTQPSGGDDPAVAPLVHDVVLHRDATAPELSNPAGERLSKAAATVTVDATEDGDLFYLVVPAGQPAPSQDQIKAGVKQDMTAGENTIVLEDLTEMGEYRVYMLAQDEAGHWTESATEAQIARVYPFSVSMATGSAANGAIAYPGTLKTEYPAGEQIPLEVTPNQGYGIGQWDDGQAGGQFTDRYAKNTVYTMPAAQAHVEVTLGVRVEFVEAVALDGSPDTATTTQVELTFSRDFEDELDVSEIDLPDGLTVTAVERTAEGVYEITIAGVSAEGEVAVGVKVPGAAIAPPSRDVLVHYDSTPPVLVAGDGVRDEFNAGSAPFEVSEPGVYYYAVVLRGAEPPTVQEVIAGGRTAAMDAGDNEIILDGADLNSSAGRVVYVVGRDQAGNTSAAPVAVSLGAYPRVTVVAGSGGSALADAARYAEGSEASLTATAFAGYRFVAWTVESGGSQALLDDSGAASTTLAVGEEDLTVKATFAKADLLVQFDLGVPSEARDEVSDWSASGQARIGEKVTAPTDAPELADFRFVGWYTEAQELDQADPSEAWDFGSGTVSAEMIAGGGTVTFYGAWASVYSDISYQLHDTTEAPATPSALGPDRVEIGSKLVDAASYTEALSRPGFVFGGWYLDANYTKPVNDSTLAQGPAATLHAQWLVPGQVNYLVRHYTVAPGGTKTLADTESYQGRIGDESVIAEPKEFPGYQFDPASSVTQGTVVAGLELKLYYDAIPVAVVFNPAGGTPTAFTVASHYGELVSAPAQEPVRGGFAFLGWGSSAVRGWDFTADRLTAANGVISGVTGGGTALGRLELTARWAAAPTVSGAKVTVGLAGQAVLNSGVKADSANGAWITSTKVLAAGEWAGQAVITADLDGGVLFDAASLPAGVYAFAVEYTDSNELTARAEFVVTVTAKVVGPVPAPDGGGAGGAGGSGGAGSGSGAGSGAGHRGNLPWTGALTGAILVPAIGFVLGGLALLLLAGAARSRRRSATGPN
jgi:uncharacterized repeat protein (TIGR02543 family)